MLKWDVAPPLRRRRPFGRRQSPRSLAVDGSIKTRAEGNSFATRRPACCLHSRRWR